MALAGDYIVFSSNPTVSLPYFELVLTAAQTQLAVHIPGVGNLTPALASLTPGGVYQLGVRYWYDADAGNHCWEYIVNGIVEAGTGPTYTAAEDAISVNVVAIGSDLGVSPIVGTSPSIPGRYDEILYWAGGNSVTDTDIEDIYKSYTYYPFANGWIDEEWGTASGGTFKPFKAVEGWDDELWGTPTFGEKILVEPINFTSCMPGCGNFVSEDPCDFVSCGDAC